MKLVLVNLSQPNESWLAEASSKYSKQISGFCPFEHISLKSKGSDKPSKLQFEEKQLLNFIEPTDVLVLLDENGKSFKNSRDFSAHLVQLLELGKKRVIFVIGGAYGFSDTIKKRSDQLWKLSTLTMSHHTATLCALEQLYRALAIWKGHPYHND